MRSAGRWARVRVRIAAVAVGVALVVGGCGTDGSRSAAPDEAGPPPPPVAPPPEVLGVQFVSPGPGEATEAVAAPPEVFDGRVPPQTPPPPQLRRPRRRGPVAAGTGVWAVVVGVNDYPGDAHDLRFAVNDARDVDAALAAAGVPASQRLVLVDGQVSPATLHAALDWLVANAGPESLAVVSLAGHARERGQTHTFVTSDGQEVTDASMAQQLTRLRSLRAWLNFGTCFGGGFSELLAPGRYLTAAAPAGQLAYESVAYGRSYLGEHMVNRGLLQKRAPAVVQSAFDYAQAAINAERPDRVPVAADHGAPALALDAPPPPAPAPTRDEQPAPEPAEEREAPAAVDPAAEPPSDPVSAGECSGLTFGVVTCS